VAAAGEAFGAGRVRDALVIGNDEQPVTGPDWLEGAAEAIAALRGTRATRLSVTGGSAVLEGGAASQAAADRINAAVAGALGVPVDRGIGLAAAPSAAEAAALETALNDLDLDVSVLFASGSAELSPDGSAGLDAIAASLIAFPGARVEVGGHTDSQGDTASNQELSLARAQAVVDYLVTAGVDPAQVEARGYGETSPIASNDTEEGRAQNRRIEFTVLEG